MQEREILTASSEREIVDILFVILLSGGFDSFLIY
jgi:hypothetical protein